MGNLKHDTKDPIYEPDTDSGMQRRDLRLPRGKELREGWSGRLRLADASCYI